MARHTRGLAKSPHLALVYGATLVDGQTDTALPSFGGGLGYAMPSAGSVVGIAATLDAATGADSTLSLDVKIGATQKSIDKAIGTAATSVSQKFAPDTHRFAAGDLIGVTYTSNTLTTNGDISVTLIVVLDDIRP
jgi:hypothetical protein